MKPTDQLFKLIGSLSKSEKRFFKLSSTLQAGEKNYMKLFDAIDGQKEYDEAGIKRQFKDENFIKHFPSEKSHLYQLILKSLRYHHPGKTIGASLQTEIKNVDILFKKALYGDCLKSIIRAKRIALKNEKFYYAFELINWEKKLIEHENVKQSFGDRLDGLLVEEQAVLGQLQNIARYKILQSQVSALYKKRGFTRNKEDHNILKVVNGDPLLNDINNTHSKRAEVTFYSIRGLLGILHADYPVALKNFSEAVKIYEGKVVLVQDDPKEYIKCLNTMLYCYLDAKNFDAFFVQIEKMKGMREEKRFSSASVQIEIFSSIYVAQLVAYDFMAEYGKAVALIDEITERLHSYEDKLGKEKIYIFYYNVAYSYFGAGEYRQALRWLHKIINENEPDIRKDVYSFAHIFNVILHFELENYELLTYMLKSTKRFYDKCKKTYNMDYKFENALIKYVRKLIRSVEDKEKTKALFRELKAEIEELMYDPAERAANKYFDFVPWIDSKLQGITFSEAKRELLHR